MGQPLNTFYCQAFGGHLYVRIRSPALLKSIQFILLKDGQVTAEQLVACKFAMFKGRGAGVYQSIAELTFSDDSVATIVSGQARIRERIAEADTATTPANQLHGSRCLTALGECCDVNAAGCLEQVAGTDHVTAALARPDNISEPVFRIATPAQFVLLDQDIGYLHQQLLRFDTVEISARNGVWRDKIVFPDAGQFPQGRILSFDSQAQWNISLVVNGRRILMSEGSAARYVAYQGRWQQIL